MTQLIKPNTCYTV